MPISYERKEIRQRGSEGFTYEEKIADVGLVDLIWNVQKKRSHGELAQSLSSRGTYGQGG